MPSDAVRVQGRQAGLQALAYARQFGAFLGRFTKVGLLTVIGLSFVAMSALLISIIQFQIRIIEAKTQSKTFSLTSLIQSVALQKEFTASVRKIQETEAVVARSLELRADYLRQSSQIVNNVCAYYKLDKQECAIKLAGILGSPRINSDIIYNYIVAIVSVPDEGANKQLRIIVDQAMNMLNEQNKFGDENKDNIFGAKLACQIIANYDLSSEGDLALAQGFLPVYVAAARNRCGFNFNVGGLVSASGPVGAGAKKADAATSDTAAPARRLEGDLGGALFFDVIAYFRFYENMFNGLCRIALAPFGTECDPRFGGDMTEQIVIAPIDISFVILVVACGALGAMLRISAETYNPMLFGKDVSDSKKTWVYYFVIGIMCSLIVYILARTVFAGLVDTTYVAKSGNMSPFVIAFMAIVSGLLCEEAFQQIIRAGRATLARSTGGKEQTEDTGGKTS